MFNVGMKNQNFRFSKPILDGYLSRKDEGELFYLLGENSPSALIATSSLSIGGVNLGPKE